MNDNCKKKLEAEFVAYWSSLWEDHMIELELPLKAWDRRLKALGIRCALLPQNDFPEESRMPLMWKRLNAEFPGRAWIKDMVWPSGGLYTEYDRATRFLIIPEDVAMKILTLGM